MLRRQLFSWREVESADYATYIANLRDIGCPEQTIRDIIIADVNQLYSRQTGDGTGHRGTAMVAQRAGHECSAALPPRRPANWRTSGGAC